MAGQQGFPVQTQYNYDYQSNPMMDAAAYQQMFGFPSFAGAMQGAMGQMQGMNQSNQNASLYNNAIQAQLQGMLGSSAYNAFGNIGSSYVGRLQQNDYLNNPLIAEQIRGNLGTEIARIQNQGLLDVENARTQQKQATLQSLMGMLGQLFPGGMNVGGGGGGLRGFTGTDGQSAILPGGAPPQPAPVAQGQVNPQAPQAMGAPPQGEINRLAQMFQPQQQQRGGGGANPALAMSRNYMDQYRGRMG